LYSAMSRNARDAADYFKIPPNRVIELGAQVEIWRVVPTRAKSFGPSLAWRPVGAYRGNRDHAERIFVQKHNF